MKTLAGALLTVLTVALLIAQTQRDFLTTDEVDQVRLAQEPNARLKLYAGFARDRIAMLQEFLSKDKAGRTVLIHNTLEDYTRLIETMDIVTEDALKKDADLTEGVKAVTDAEEEMLAALRQIQDSDPPDVARYQFVLTTAIETTEDSLDLASEDLGERKKDVEARDAREEKERETLMTPTEVDIRREAEKKAKEEKQKRKAPTLRRKGEEPPPKKQ